MPVVVVDASVVVAGLIDNSPDGRWAERMLTSGSLAAPHLLPAEVANVVRRATLAGKITADAANLAHADLAALRVDLFPYEPFAGRIWELRGHVTCYDAWYVALAECLGCPLVTLDARLSRAPGVTCAIRLPESEAQFCSAVAGPASPAVAGPSSSTGTSSRSTSASPPAT